MQKKLLTIILLTALTYSCSKDLANKDKNQNNTQPTQAQAPANPNELVRQAIYFDTNSHALSSQNSELVKQALSSYLETNKKLVIVSEGHCDERGSSKYNFQLGKKRALAVKKFLVKNLKVKSSRISIVSYGENKPANLGHDENAWSKNRRVEIVVLK